MVDLPEISLSSMPTPGPRSEYGRRAGAGQARADRLALRYRRFLRARTVAVGLIVALGWLAEKERLLPVLLSLPVVGFVAAVLEKNRVLRAWQRAYRVVRFYQRRIANLEDLWPGMGAPGNRFLNDAHPYARDLDLFGAGSLFERLHLAGTPLGEETLAAWLGNPAPAGEVRDRQAAVAELRARLDLREELALQGEQLAAPVNLDALAAWSAAPAPTGARTARVLASALTCLAALTALGCLLELGPTPLLALLAMGAGVELARRRWRLMDIPIGTDELRPILAMFVRLRRERFGAPLLCRLQATLAARPLGQLARLLAAQPYAPLAFPFLGSTHVALALEAWRIRHGRAMTSWLAALGSLEALNALAAYAYETPADPFPEILDEGPCFEARALGHPLLPASRCVRNDVRLSADQRVLIVSGSNMSGKSTLLRTVGASAVLALAGAPVRAVSLRLAPVSLGATLRFEDSLLGGRSRFFAEVTRIRQLLDLARAQPLLFLFDELFSGTNSEDRRQGAEAVVRRLLDAGAIGLLTTHDLALAQLATRLGACANNVHFSEQFAGDVMTFDYRMRPGVLQSGNGLALMRAVGIDVPGAGSP